MSQTAQVSPVPKWRSGAPAGAPRARRRRVVFLLAIVALAGVGIALALPYLRPPVRCHLVGLAITEYRDRELGVPPWRAQDHQAIAEGAYFASRNDAPPGALGGRALMQELEALRRGPSSAVVVYLTAFARTTPDGRLHVLPSDADRDDPTSWIAFRQVLTALQAAKARRYLVLLDLLPARDTSNDLMARVPAELDAVPDDRRFVLCSHSPGGRAWASEALGRSAFGHYVEEGLRGWADRSGDGRVSARELAAFVQSRVDRWARRARGARQVPVLYGEGRDFALVDLPNGRPRDHREMPDDRAYPAALAEAWKKAGSDAQRRALLRAELDWRAGAELGPWAVPTAKAAPSPRARSLALAARGRAPTQALLDELRRSAYLAETKSRGLAADKAGEMRGKLVADFVKGQQAVPPAVIGRAAIDLAIADARPERVRFLGEVVRAIEPEPEHVETLLLPRLAALGLTPQALARALEVVRDGEQALAEAEVFPWVAGELEAMARRQHEALVLLLATGYAPRADGERALDEASAQQISLQVLQRLVREALAARGAARALLPWSLAARDEAGATDAAWRSAATLTAELSERLEAARGGRLRDHLDELRQQSAALRGRLEELGAPFTPEGLTRLVRAAGRGAAGPAAYRELTGTLLTPLIDGAARPGAWQAAMALSRRLEEEVLRLDRLDGTKVGEAEAAPEARRGDESALLTRAMRPTANDAVALQRAWLADWYRYQAREHAALAPGGAEAELFRRAAEDYRGYLRQVGEEYVEITEASDPPRLLPTRPITLALQARAVTTARVAPALRLQLLAPGAEWLSYSPTAIDLRSPLARTADGRWQVPVNVALRPTAGQGAPPLGLLARAVAAGGRAYHQPIAVPLTPRSPQVVLTRDEKGTGPGLPNVRLRAVPGKQSLYLQVQNPIDRAYRALVVRLSAAGEVRESAPFALPSRGTQVVRFAAPAAAAPAAPGAAAALPELTGAMVVQVLDRDGGKNETLTTREVDVDLAHPSDYVAITAVRFDPAGGRNRLTVQLRQKQPVAGPPVTVALAFPALEDGGATHTTGTLQGKLPADGKEITLFAEGVSGNPLAPTLPVLFHLSVDGWARAFVFQVTLRSTSAVTPEQVDRAQLRPRVAAFAQAGPKFTIPVEVDNAPAGARLEVEVGRLVGGQFRQEAIARRETARARRIGFNPAGKGGALELEASLSDWAIVLDTSGIRGAREVRARLLDREGVELRLAPRAVVFSDEGPSGVRFVSPPAKAWAKAPLALRATASDTIVGVKEANFFVGKPAGDKVPEGAKKVAGVADAAGKVWSVKLPVPPGKSGETDVSVEMVNAAGLRTFETISIDLTEEDPAKTAPGTITGTVSEGERPQAGLSVVLSDEKGAAKGTAMTGADGAFQFKDVAPGKYRLGTTKSSNQRKGAFPRAAGETFEVKPGATVTAPIALFLE